MADDLENDFLRFMEVERSASPRTLVNYRLALESCRTWFGAAFPGWRDTAADDFRRWLFDMMKQGLSKATIRLRFAAVRSFYKFLVHRRGLAKSPVAEVQLPKPEKKLPVVLNLAQIDELLALPLRVPLHKQTKPWMPLRDAAILELFYSCGLRISELRGLDVKDIDFLGENVRVRGKVYGDGVRLATEGQMDLLGLKARADPHRGGQEHEAGQRHDSVASADGSSRRRATCVKLCAFTKP